jgi:hypothetical protein
MKCPYCGNEHPDRARFCPTTGQSLEYASSTSVTCPNCGKSIPAEAQFCPLCGFVLTVAETDQPGVIPTGGFFKRIFVWVAGALAIFIIGILAIVSFNQGWLKADPPGPTVIEPIGTALVKQTEGSPFVQGDSYSTPTQTSMPSPTQNEPTITIPATKTLKPTAPPRKSCPGAPPIRVEIGDRVRVMENNGKPLYMRSNPVVGKNIQWYLYGGAELKILLGPECSDDVSFFKVEDLSNGHVGWVPEAVADSNSYLISKPLY